MSYERKIISVNITDPGADKRVPLLRVPARQAFTLEAAYVVADTDTVTNVTNYWQCSLENGGAAGTAQTPISAVAGGTAGWTANVPKALAITAGLGELAEGQYLNLNYNEEGTVAPGRFTVILEYVNGVGATA